jgi:hypothetical protein
MLLERALRVEDKLNVIVSAPQIYFGSTRTVKYDCFDRQSVDDGIVFYKEMRSSLWPNEYVFTTGWDIFLGGNPKGYLPKSMDDSTEKRQVSLKIVTQTLPGGGHTKWTQKIF